MQTRITKIDRNKPELIEIQCHSISEEVREIVAFVKSVDRTSSMNLNVINIIREEAGPYFAGQKALDETVRIIQNRVSTVIAESR